MATSAIKKRQKNTWLLLMHQIPPKPEALRVRVWRSLQRLGTFQIKNSVYALPNNPKSQKALASLAQEIEAGGGEAIICESDFLHGVNSAALIEEYNKKLEAVFKGLLVELDAIKKSLGKKKNVDLMGVEHALGRIRSHLQDASVRNTFECKFEKTCRDLLVTIDTSLSKRSVKTIKQAKRSYKSTTWVTRADIRVDRMASAWLIKRHIDLDAKFMFVNAKTYQPKNFHVRYDMFGAEFTHESDLCTFEVLLKKFKIEDLALMRIAQVIHDLDIKDERYALEETAGIQAFLEGLAKRESDDQVRLRRAFSFFDSLASSFR